MLQRILAVEPAVFINAITSVVGLLVAAGLLTQANGDAMLTSAAAVIPAALTILGSLLTRHNVFSQATVSKLLADEQEDYA